MLYFYVCFDRSGSSLNLVRKIPAPQAKSYGGHTDRENQRRVGPSGSRSVDHGLALPSQERFPGEQRTGEG